ncbi:hypothetical protein VTK56DRAFT_590 [Thermocarpiscus australiensis]
MRVPNVTEDDLWLLSLSPPEPPCPCNAGTLVCNPDVRVPPYDTCCNTERHKTGVCAAWVRGPLITSHPALQSSNPPGAKGPVGEVWRSRYRTAQTLAVPREPSCSLPPIIGFPPLSVGLAMEGSPRRSAHASDRLPPSIPQRTPTFRSLFRPSRPPTRPKGNASSKAPPPCPPPPTCPVGCILRD